MTPAPAIVVELPDERRAETARLVLQIGLVAALFPMALALGALLLLQIGVIDWWTAYGRVLIGDGTFLPYALQAVLAAVAATAAGLFVTLWADVERFYVRAMLNLAITGASLLALVMIGD